MSRIKSEDLWPPTMTRRSNARQNENLMGWLFAAPAVVLMLTFLIIPFLMAFALAFTNQRLISPNPTEFVGSRNFVRLLTVRTLTLDPVPDPVTGKPMLDDVGSITYPRLRDFTRNNPKYPELDGLQEFKTFDWGSSHIAVLVGDAVFIKSLLNTLFFVVLVVPIQGGLALLLALIVNQRTSGINIFRTIYFMPVVISMVVVSILWKIIYDSHDGLLNNLLSLVTFGAFKPVDWLGTPANAMPSILVMSVWQGVGFHMVIWLAGLQTIPGMLYEAASVEGANAWQKFRFVTWPGLRNTTIFILVTITMAAFGLFTQVNVMTRGGPLDATTSVLFQAVLRGYEKQDIAAGSTISVIYFLVVLSIALVQRFLTRERDA